MVTYSNTVGAAMRMVVEVICSNMEVVEMEKEGAEMGMVVEEICNNMEVEEMEKAAEATYNDKGVVVKEMVEEEICKHRVAEVKVTPVVVEICRYMEAVAPVMVEAATYRHKGVEGSEMVVVGICRHKVRVTVEVGIGDHNSAKEENMNGRVALRQLC